MKKHEIREKVARITGSDPRYTTLIVHFLRGKPYRNAEPVTKRSLESVEIRKYAGILDVSRNSILGCILQYKGLWNENSQYHDRIPENNEVAVAFEAWLKVPEDPARKARREQARAAYMEARRARAAKYR